MWGDTRHVVGETGLNSSLEFGYMGVNRQVFPESTGPSESSFYNFKIFASWFKLDS